MAVDIVEQLRCHFVDCDGTCATVVAANEIVRLRAEVERLTNGNNIMGLLWNAERALVDQLAEVLRLVDEDSYMLPIDTDEAVTAALAAHEAARKEEQ